MGCAFLGGFFYLKGVGGQLSAWLSLTSVHFYLIHLIWQNKEVELKHRLEDPACISGPMSKI